MSRPSLPRRTWSRLPPGVRSWLSTYAGPVLGVLVVAALLINLAANAGRSQADPQVTDSASRTADRVQRLPDLVTVSPDFSAPATSGGPAQRAVTAAASRPTKLRLSSGTVVPVQPVGTADDGALDIPGDIRVAGWWRGGARLGDPFGSMLIAAHVDSRTQGLGPYAVLLSVKPGDEFQVTGSKNLTQTFAVRERRVVARDKLSTVPDIFSPRGSPRLTMVTCAGPYDSDDGGYQNLAVVTAEPVGGPSVG